MPPLTNADAQWVIDKHIRGHQDAILALKTRRNTFSAISMLPTEILSSIFIETKALLDHPEIMKGKHWRSIAGVSRHWRDIALDTPRLWNSIKLSQGELALRMLQRSKSVPLDIICLSDYDHHKFGFVAQVSLAEIARVHKIDISASDSNALAEFLNWNLKSSAPALEMLDLSLSNSECLPKNAFWRDMPALRALTLTATFPLSELPFLPSLTELDLYADDFSSGVPLSWLIKSLRNTPNVEDVDVSGVASDNLIERSMSPPVSLHKLSRLGLGSKDLGVTRIFNCLDYPNSTAIEYFCGSTAGEIAAQLHHLAGLHIAASRFAKAEDAASISEVELCTTTESFEIQFPNANGDSLFEVILPGETDAIPHYMQLFTSLPIATVPMLNVRKIHPSDVEHVLQLLPQFQQLQTLRLFHCCPTAIAGLLRADGAEKPPCPKLETITMVCCPFESDPAREPNVDKCGTVVHVVKERKRYGFPIHKLTMRHCAIPTEALQALKEYVDVDWDECHVDAKGDDADGGDAHGGDDSH